ncbi:CRP/FNR family transcriptional regulator [Pullulanibacillus pueri]|uniref:Crp/Fnr family transcriptional regulator n=1 Tax=Pullulanibacillus pueri TaxID=1437324 RepID=A0A8J3EKT4_9BACL|nr:Crp/Fnr family transcriptional regulator [Pullulanibacillus pueri]MBM7680319.1 CRP/FNR family transcriptional regulator [Pullulanibacillus pueri]GGH75678.1 Crp/Fnr family transcriptional regulator [Pullulanibacillus pueri]
MVQTMELEGKLSVESNTLAFKSLNIMERNSMTKTFAKKEIIYCEGDRCDYLYYVLEGTVKLSSLSEDGKDFIMQYFYPGDLFGEFDRADEKKHADFCAMAVTDCKIAYIEQSEINTLLMLDGNFAVEFSSWMSQMQHYTQLKLRDILFYGKNGALASTIIRAANTYGVHKGDTIFISKRFTNYEIANMIGATRETVNRMLIQFDKAGWINYSNGHITILKLNELKKICHCEDCPLGICRL